MTTHRDNIGDITCCAESVILRELPWYGITCGVFIIEKGTDRMVFVEQRAREELPPGIIGIPKGQFEPSKDRTFRDCALRELKEETGLDLTGTVLKRLLNICNPARTRLLVVYGCVVDEIPPLRCGPEIERIIIMGPDDLANIQQKSMSKETAQIARFISAIAGAISNIETHAH